MHPDSLQPALDEGWIVDVLLVVKSGKEATVYLCQGGARAGRDLLAAKVYRARQDRTFQNDAAYLEGGLRSAGRRVQLAASKRTQFGRSALFSRWVGRELEALTTLHRAGARVPEPLGAEAGAILLAWIGDGEEAAPPLRHFELTRPAAIEVLDHLLRQVELFLACNLVHGDLSEYNVLMLGGEPVVIDFPQAVDPRFNRAARDLLRRDLHNLARFFRRHGVAFDAERRAADLWRRWMRSELALSSSEPDPALSWVDTRRL